MSLGASAGQHAGFRTLGVGILVLALETMGGTGQEIRFQGWEELHMTHIPLQSTATTSLHNKAKGFWGNFSLKTASRSTEQASKER